MPSGYTQSFPAALTNALLACFMTLNKPKITLAALPKNTAKNPAPLLTRFTLLILLA